MRPAVMALACLLACCCCSKSRDGSTPKQNAGAESPAAAPQAAAPASEAARDTSIAGAAPAGQFPGTLSQIEERYPTLTVTEVLAGSGRVGETIRVEGRCLGYGKVRAEGGPPVTRSDWQLEEGGAAIYVTGPLPEGCSATEGSTTRTAIYATIAEDNPPALGGKPAKTRRYLVRAAR
jgi:hypothetical protein